MRNRSTRISHTPDTQKLPAEGNLWRGMRNAALPSLGLWLLIIWAFNALTGN